MYRRYISYTEDLTRVIYHEGIVKYEEYQILYMWLGLRKWGQMRKYHNMTYYIVLIALDLNNKCAKYCISIQNIKEVMALRVLTWYRSLGSGSGLNIQPFSAQMRAFTIIKHILLCSKPIYSCVVSYWTSIYDLLNAYHFWRFWSIWSRDLGSKVTIMAPNMP
jgi:hypothetical protein